MAVSSWQPHVRSPVSPWSRLNATLLSYDGTCTVGVTIDEAAIPDADLLMACLAEGFDEVLSIAGHGPAARLPLHEASFPGETRPPRRDRLTGGLSRPPARTRRPCAPSRGAVAHA